MPIRLRNENGFTLIELVMVMVLLAIIGAMGADFISHAFKGFQNTDTRIEIFEEGKTALARMEREISNAVPNAVNVSSATDITVGLISEQDMQTVTGRYTESAPTDTITDSSGNALTNDSIVSIYNLSWTQFATTTISQRRLYKVSGNPMVVDPTSIYKTAIIASSPKQRYYAVDKAVRYYLDGTTLQRAQVLIDQEDEDLSFGSVQAYPLATGVSGLTFSYSPGTLTRNGVVAIALTITKRGEAITFHKEITSRNVP